MLNETKIAFGKRIQATGLWLALVAILATQLPILVSAQQNCYADSKLPKLFQDSDVDEKVFSMAGSTTIEAIFAGGSADYAGQTAAFIMRMNVDSKMTKWRRFFGASGSPMNAVTAMVVSPDGQTLACLGSVSDDTTQWYHTTWFWTIRSSDAAYLTDVTELTHGNAGLGEHIVRDQSLQFVDSNTLFATFYQSGSTLRSRGDLNSYAGRMAVARLDPANESVTWIRQHQHWGYSLPLVYKNFGAGFHSLFVGGGIDKDRFDDSIVPASWRLAISVMNEDGSGPGTEGTFWFEPSNTNDESGHYISHMHLDDTYDGSDWLFGTTAVVDPAGEGSLLWAWKLSLDPTTKLPSSTNLEVFAHNPVNQQGVPGVVLAVRSTLDASGQMHYILQQGSQVQYMKYGWTGANTNAQSIYDDLYDGTAIFYGLSEVIQPLVAATEVSEAYIGGSMADLVSSSQSAVVLSSHRQSLSCLTPVSVFKKFKVPMETSTASGTTDLDWEPFSLTGMGTASLLVSSWDAPASTRASEEWCSPSATITDIQAGRVDHGICFQWDGIWRTVEFTPPTAFTSAGACGDPATAWMYSVDRFSYDPTIMQIYIDSALGLIYFKPLTAGSGTLQLDLTVDATDPNANISSFTLSIQKLSGCEDKAPVAPTFLDQSYIIQDPLAGYEPAAFTVDPTCPQQVNYYNSVSPVSFINGVYDNFGMGKLVQWQTDDVADMGLYTVEIAASNSCAVTKVTYELEVIAYCSDADSVTPPPAPADVDYVVTDPSVSVSFDEFTALPSWCQDQQAITYSISPVSGQPLIQNFDLAARTFTFFHDSDLSLSGGPQVQFLDYTVTVTSTAGDTVQQSASISFNVRVMNPCYLAAYVQIEPSVLPAGPLSYVLMDGSLASPVSILAHSDWAQSTLPIQHAYCGPIAYLAKVDGLAVDETSLASIGVSYSQVSQAFAVYSEDTNLIGQTLTITLEAYLEDYPIIVSDPLDTYSIDLQILDPCISPFSLEAPAQTSPPDYFYGNPQATFTMDPFVVDPPICPVTYACSVTSGPRTDICSLADGTTVSVFDPSTGDYSFESTDMANYSPGVYEFAITGTSGDKTQIATWTFTVVDPCPTAPFSLEPNPFPDPSYTLRDVQLDTPWTQDSLYQLDSPVDCGPVTVTLLNSDLSAVDSGIFGDVRDPVSNTFSVLYSELVTIVGEYDLVYTVSLDDYARSLTQIDPFRVTIVDPCDPPTSLIASSLADQSYTITDVAANYQIPAFTVDPAWCDVAYTMSVSDPALLGALNFDPDQAVRTFSIFEDSDLSLAGPTFNDYTVTVSAEAGVNSKITDSSQLTWTVKNPCIDPVFVEIQTVLLSGPYQYALWDFDPTLGYQFTHSPFSVVTQPITHSLCGVVAYNAFFDSAQITVASDPLSHDEASLTFEMYSEDFSLLGLHSIEVQGYLEDYPSMQSLVESTTIEILDPCISPFLLVAPAQTSPPDYFYANPQATFTMDPFVVDPPICPVTYACSVTSGPRTDICSLADGTTVSVFDPSTGDYSFESTDMANYSPGVYEFAITGTSGDKTQIATWTFTVVDPCPTAPFSLEPNPFPDPSYTLRDVQLDTPWTQDSLYQLDSPVDCGPVTVTLLNSDLSAVDSGIFGDVRDPVSNTFSVLYSELVTIVGEYDLVYTVSLDDYARSLTQTDPFRVTIVDPCDPPTSLIASSLADQSYTITDVAANYQIPAFTVDPAWCDVAYTMSVSDPALLGALNFDPDQAVRTFSIFEDSDLSLAGPTFNDYTVTVSAEAGVNSKITDSSQLTWTVKNPCIDPVFVEIQTVLLSGPYQYALWDFDPTLGYQFTHSPFSVVTQPITHSLCGDVAYNAFFDSAQITVASDPLSHDEASLTFEMYSENFSLLGLHSIEVQGYLKDYPSMQSLVESTTIEILDPCISPFLFVAPAQTSPPDYFYGNPQATFTMDPFVVDPPICPVTYACSVTSGPRTDICSLADGTTVSVFDPSTGDYSFESTDMANYSPGVYEFAITGTSGDKTQIATWTFTVVDPCPTAPFSLEPNPFPDPSYTLRDVQLETPWTQDSLYQLDSPVDCGPVTVTLLNSDLSAVDSGIFGDVRDPVSNTFSVLYSELVTIVGEYDLVYTVSLDDYARSLTQIDPFRVTIVDPCDPPTSLIASSLADQSYTITDVAANYQIPAFTVDPAWCEMTYSFTSSDPLILGSLTFDLDQTVRTFSIFEDSDLAPSGSVNKVYQIEIFAQAGVNSLINDSTSFTWTINNPCVDASYVTISSAILPANLQYLLWDFDPTLGYQFTHSPFSVVTQPITHSLCGVVAYNAFFDSAQITVASDPLSHDEASLTFEMYSEDFSLLGLHSIEVQGYLKDYPSMQSLVESTTIEILDPCTDPFSITAPTQPDAEDYLYTVRSLMLNTVPFQVDPPICPVSYECASSSIPNASCQDTQFLTVDPQQGTIRVQSTDMQQHPPGSYIVTLRGSSGSVNTITAEVAIQIVLVDPCPTARLTFTDSQFFRDVNYLLGDGAIEQAFDSKLMLKLGTEVDCGMPEISFEDEYGADLDQRFFLSDDDSFTVVQQEKAESVGQHLIFYSASLKDYPGVKTDTQGPFAVQIEAPVPQGSNTVVIVMPEWLSMLKDLQSTIGEPKIVSLGEPVNQFGDSMDLQFDFGGAKGFTSYNDDLNIIVIDGTQIRPEDIGEWLVRVEATFADQTGTVHTFKKSLSLSVNPSEPLSETEKEPEQTPEETEQEPTLNDFEGIVITESQVYSKERPVPYIASFTPTGVLQIAWDRRMKPLDKPKVIPDTTVAVDIDVYNQPKTSLEREEGRRLQKQVRQEKWFLDQVERERRRMILLDALEVKMVKEELLDEESNLAYFKWDVLDFNEDFIWLQIDFENPTDLGAFASKDYITVTFWGVEFFKSFNNIEVEFGYKLKQRIFRMIDSEDLESLESIQQVIDTCLASASLPLLALLGFGGRLLPTWMFINSMQLIVHASLIPSYFPSSLHYFLTHYLGYLRLSSPELDERLEVAGREQNAQEFSALEEEDESTLISLLRMIGYSHSMARNLALVTCLFAVIIVCLGLATLLGFLESHLCVKKQRGKWRHLAWFSNFSLRFAYEMYLEVCLCVMVQLTLYRQETALSPLLWISTFIVALLTIAMVALTAKTCCSKGPYLPGTYAQSSFWPSLWAKRELAEACAPKSCMPQTEHQSEDKAESERNLLQLGQQQAIKESQSDPQTFEGGSLLESRAQQRANDVTIRREAIVRVELANQVKLSPWHKTLFFGLKVNQAHVTAVVHPLAFMVRRVLYAVVITCTATTASLFSGALVLLSTCLFMLAMVWAESIWESRLINQQHFVNETVFYLICVALLSFQGVITSTRQGETYGWLLVTLVVALIFYNILVIAYDAWCLIRLQVRRSRLLFKHKTVKNRVTLMTKEPFDSSITHQEQGLIKEETPVRDEEVPEPKKLQAEGQIIPSELISVKDLITESEAGRQQPSISVQNVETPQAKPVEVTLHSPKIQILVEQQDPMSQSQLQLKVGNTPRCVNSDKKSSPAKDSSPAQDKAATDDKIEGQAQDGPEEQTHHLEGRCSVTPVEPMVDALSQAQSQPSVHPYEQTEQSLESSKSYFKADSSFNISVVDIDVQKHKTRRKDYLEEADLKEQKIAENDEKTSGEKIEMNLKPVKNKSSQELEVVRLETVRGSEDNRNEGERDQACEYKTPKQSIVHSTDVKSKTCAVAKEKVDQDRLLPGNSNFSSRADQQTHHKLFGSGSKNETVQRALTGLRVTEPTQARNLFDVKRMRSVAAEMVHARESITRQRSVGGGDRSESSSLQLAGLVATNLDHNLSDASSVQLRRQRIMQQRNSGVSPDSSQMSFKQSVSPILSIYQRSKTARDLLAMKSQASASGSGSSFNLPRTGKFGREKSPSIAGANSRVDRDSSRRRSKRDEKGVEGPSFNRAGSQVLGGAMSRVARNRIKGLQPQQN